MRRISQEKTVIKIIVLVLAQLLLVSVSSFASDMTSKDVSDIAEKLKSGKPVKEFNRTLLDQTQQIRFAVGQLQYVIDFRAKLCFAQYQDMTLIPCKSLKDGYPLIAPLIDWEK